METCSILQRTIEDTKKCGPLVLRKWAMDTCHCIICHLCNNIGSCKSRPENEVWHRTIPSTSPWCPGRNNEDGMDGSAQAACYLSPSPFIHLVSYCNWEEQEKCKFSSCLVPALSCLFSLLSCLQQGIIWQAALICNYSQSKHLLKEFIACDERKGGHRCYRSCASSCT